MVYIVGSKNISSAAQLGPDVVGASEIAENSVGDSEIAAHTTTKITTPTSLLSGTLVIGHFADNIITPAKFENGTRGDIYHAGASGVFTRLAAGASGTVLKSNGAASDPSWGAAAVPFFLPLVSATSSTTGQTSGLTYVDLAASGDTPAMASFFMPSGAITSIQVLLQAASGGGGNNMVADFTFNHVTDNAADTEDFAATQVITDMASSSEKQLVTVPTTAYDGLTQGKIWAFKLTRKGDEGGDTITTAVRAYGVLINI